MIVALGSLVFLWAVFILGVRALAKVPIQWILVPGNTFAVIVGDDDGSGNMTQGGGPIVDVHHSVPGKIMDMRDANQMNWKFRNLRKGEKDPRQTGFIYKLTKAQTMSNPFNTVRTNKVKSFRYSKNPGDPEFKTLSKDENQPFLPFSGETTVQINDADTKDGVGINLEIDMIFERWYPVRAAARVADSNAFLSSLAEEVVNAVTARHKASDFFGKGGEQSKKEVTEAFENKTLDAAKKFRREALKQLGLKIPSVVLRTATPTDAHKAMLVRKEDARTAGEADLAKRTFASKAVVIESKAEKEAQINRNDAAADRLLRVEIPAARSPRLTSIHRSEIEWEGIKGSKIHTYIRGGIQPVYPVGSGSPSTHTPPQQTQQPQRQQKRQKKKTP